MTLRVAIVGASGRMGRYTGELLAGREGFRVVAAVSSGEALAESLAVEAVDVGVDFTRAGLGAEHARTMLAAGVRPLVGTSGVTPEEVLQLDQLARESDLGGLVVPNFSLGVWLQQRLALEALKTMPHVEVIEEHHHSKLDAPSATAADSARRLERARAATGLGSVPIHSIRVPGLYSNQTMVFGGAGEVLRITHETYGLEAFGRGILAGLQYAAEARGVAVGLDHAIEAGLLSTGVGLP